MANKINDLKTKLGAGARPNKYRVIINAPEGITLGDNETPDLLCKAANFPGMTIGQIEVWNQGRKLVLPGDTSFDNTWTVTFYQTEDHSLRKAFLEWLKAADNFQNNTHNINPSSVMTSMSVEQLDGDGNSKAKYSFDNVFVQAVGEIGVGDDNQDTAMEFDVTFSFTDWVVGDISNVNS